VCIGEMSVASGSDMKGQCGSRGKDGHKSREWDRVMCEVG